SPMPGGAGGSGGNGDEPPDAGAMRGAAALTTATGRYWKDVTQASLTREKVRQAAIDTRRRLLDEARYERMMMPTAQTLLDRERAADLARSRKGAPSVDVWSGKALNDLLGSMVKARLGAGPSIPLDDDMLKGINLTDAGTTGNLGLLKEAKDDGKLPWPRSLTSPRFDKLRARVERSAQDALFSIKREKKAPEEATLNNLGRALKAL